MAIRQYRLSWILLLCSAALMLQVALSTVAAAGTAGSYRLGSGDEVRVTVFHQPDLSGQFLIGADGMISLPLIGNLPAAGASVRDLEMRIQDALQPEYLKNPSVSVEVLNYRPFYILGQVDKPGSYPFVSGMLVVNAVALAGGYTARASMGGIYIERPGAGAQIKVTPQTPVMPGDIIHVPERFF
ncbi:polysaccharide biosynthesis/export family protein [Emcibacter sp. SYSU 3D8]|uniref:polysaccharide biosynthesis/export family protein n=1 Tax=Emcibacter sp. SYSU 3D8 TaxID=3133969 RepID=UPI0031FEABF5